jgi:hypothetical protein
VTKRQAMGAVFKIYASTVALKMAATFIGRGYERNQCPNIPSESIVLPRLQNRTYTHSGSS